MLGAYIVFAAVLAIVITYMLIVHRFLVSAEEPEDQVREHQRSEKPAARPAKAHRPEFAH